MEREIELQTLFPSWEKEHNGDGDDDNDDDDDQCALQTPCTSSGQRYIS